MQLLVNIDVPDVQAAARFYCDALGLRIGRRLGAAILELLGGDSAIYLLQKAEGSEGAPGAPRRYARHWTPLHLDIVVKDVDAAVERAVSAGATLEVPVATSNWGKIATLADPFGNGFCLVQFLGRGYDELVE